MITRQRLINGNLKKSVLDHVYLRSPVKVLKLLIDKTIIGDHSLVMFDIQCFVYPPEILMKRIWKNYTKDLLFDELSTIDFNIQADDPQSIWNQFEQNILTVIDELAP